MALVVVLPLLAAGMSLVASQAVALPPVITGVAPSAGISCGGRPVVITGSNFLGADLVGGSVKFGDILLTPSSYSVDSDNQITVNAAPAHVPGSVDVVVTTLSGSSATSAADRYTYVAKSAVVSGLSSSRGPTAGGTAVTLTGSCFVGVTSVQFGASPASFTVGSPTQITVSGSPAKAAGDLATVDVTVTNAGGTSPPTPGDLFTYVAAPTVTAVSPNRAPTGGGSSVAIVGTGFFGGTASSNISAVRFGGIAVGSYTVDSDIHITVSGHPPGPVGTADITVSTDGGASATSSADRFTWVAPPSLTGLSVRRGPAGGGGQLVISGNGFFGGTTSANVRSVSFGGATAAPGGYTVDSDTQITVSAAPPKAPSDPYLVDVRVTTDGGATATSPSDRYTYVAAPTVSSVSPARAPLAGGTAVTITGTGFFGGTGSSNVSAVKFGTSAATAYTVNSDTQITATDPAQSAGTVDVTVSTDGGTSPTGSADQFTYAPVPIISGVSPSRGPLSGGTSVTLTGSGFTAATSVMFGSTAASGYTVTSDSQATATSPAGAVGAVDITITTPGGTSAMGTADRFTYVAAPTVSAISPTRGPTGGGSTVTITGTGFFGGTAISNVSAVKFGTGAAPSYTVNSDTQITATSPAGSAGVVDVTVTTDGGPSATGTADRFTYVTPPTVDSVNPNLGPAGGGTTVTITGTGFFGGTAISNVSAVKFGTGAATAYTVNSDTQITATSPARTGGTVDVVVTTDGGPSATGPGDKYGYVPAVTSISINHGPSKGGTSVVISGSGFTGATSVKFGTVAAAYSVNSDTQVAATSPGLSPLPASLTTLDVTVTTPVATSATSAADQFTYQSSIVAAVGYSDNAMWVKQGSGAWTSLGGILLGAPAVTSVPQTNAPSAPLYIGTGNDHNLWVRSASAGWQALTPAGSYCIDNPAAVVVGSPGSATLYVACQGGDRALWYISGAVTAGGLPVLTGWTSLGGTNINAGPAVAMVNGYLTFAVTTSQSSNNVWFWASYSGWYQLPFTCTGHPALASNASRAYFGCNGGGNSQLWYTDNTGTPWRLPLTSLGGGVVDGPGIAMTSTDLTDPTMFVEGQDTHVYETSPSRGATNYIYDGFSVKYGVGASGIE